MHPAGGRPRCRHGLALVLAPEGIAACSEVAGWEGALDLVGQMPPNKSRLQLLRTVSDNGVEFLDKAAAALGPLGGIAEFEAETGDGTEIGRRITLVQVIEQGGANVVDGADVDPGLSVGESVDASPGRGVLPYRSVRKGITAVSCERPWLPSNSEVAPTQLQLRFRRNPGRWRGLSPVGCESASALASA